MNNGTRVSIDRWAAPALVVGLALAGIAILLPASAAAGQADGELILERWVERTDGNASAWRFTARVIGNALSTASVTSPAAVTLDLVLGPDPGDFDVQLVGTRVFGSEAALLADFPDGDYQFTIDGAMPTAMPTVAYDVESPDGFADFTAPANGSVDVPSDQTFSFDYSCSNCEALQGSSMAGTRSQIDTAVSFVGGAEIQFFPVTPLPPPMDPRGPYDFNFPQPLPNGLLVAETESFRLRVFADVAVGAQSFRYEQAGIDRDAITFRVPEPARAPAYAIALLALLLMGRRPR